MTKHSAPPYTSRIDGPVGGIVLGPGDILLRSDDETLLEVENTSTWPVVISSHFHFFEVNRKLRFDRALAFGKHLNVIAGGSVRFEPGEVTDVGLVQYHGERAIFGFNGMTNCVLGDGDVFRRQRASALERIRAAGYLHRYQSS